MSKIIEKAFDASKKIIRSVFRGSPNLFTTSDINRQIESLKAQIDQLYERVGFISDISVTPALTSGTLKVTFDFTYLEFKGCSFNPAKQSLEINFTNSAPYVYMCLTADKKLVTYESDSSHEISGASFEDGSFQPSADNYVYENEQIILTHSLSDVENLVGVIKKFELYSDGEYGIYDNVLGKSSAIRLEPNSIIHYDKTVKQNVKKALSYDAAFSSLENRLAIVEDYTYTIDSWETFTVDTGRGDDSAVDLKGKLYGNKLFIYFSQLNVPANDSINNYIDFRLNLSQASVYLQEAINSICDKFPALDSSGLRKIILFSNVAVSSNAGQGSTTSGDESVINGGAVIQAYLTSAGTSGLHFRVSIVGPSLPSGTEASLRPNAYSLSKNTHIIFGQTLLTIDIPF